MALDHDLILRSFSKREGSSRLQRRHDLLLTKGLGNKGRVAKFRRQVGWQRPGYEGKRDALLSQYLRDFVCLSIGNVDVQKRKVERFVQNLFGARDGRLFDHDSRHCGGDDRLQIQGGEGFVLENQDSLHRTLQWGRKSGICRAGEWPASTYAAT